MERNEVWVVLFEPRDDSVIIEGVFASENAAKASNGDVEWTADADGFYAVMDGGILTITRLPVKTA